VLTAGGAAVLLAEFKGMSHENQHKPTNHSVVPHNMPQTKTRNDLGWKCSLCGLSSVQKAENSYIKHLEDLHDEERPASNLEEKKWRENLIYQAFIKPSYKYE
jgi:hypothetical protein